MEYPGEMAWTVYPGLMVFPVHPVQEENLVRMAETVPKGKGGHVVPLGHKGKEACQDLEVVPEKMGKMEQQASNLFWKKQIVRV